MRSKFAAYSLFARSAWFIIAVMLLICCGPVKRLIESRFDKGALTTSVFSLDNKLKTGYREKRDIATFTPVSTHQSSPDVDIAPLFVTCLFVALLGATKAVIHRPSVAMSMVGQQLPLYLQIRKLQV